MIDLSKHNTVMNRIKGVITSVSMENQDTGEIVPADLRVEEAILWLDNSANEDAISSKMHPLSMVYSGDDPASSIAFTIGYLTAMNVFDRGERIVVIEEPLTQDVLQKYLSIKARNRADRLRDLAKMYEGDSDDGS
jgi:hypothetical protein